MASRQSLHQQAFTTGGGGLAAKTTPFVNHGPTRSITGVGAFSKKMIIM